MTYSATVAAASGTAAPTGTVTFTTGTTTLCTAALTNGQASCTATTAPAGTDTITAAYSGANGFNPSTGTTTETVTAVTTTLAVTPGSPSLACTTETLTATLTPPGAAGTVQFRDATTNVGLPVPVANGTAARSTALPVGRHTLTAVFSPTDPAAFTGSTSTSVPYLVYATTTKIITAAPTVPGVPVVLLAQVSGLAVTTVAPLTAGAHTLTAVFTPTNPTAFGPSTSTPVTVNVR